MSKERKINHALLPAPTCPLNAMFFVFCFGFAAHGQTNTDHAVRRKRKEVVPSEVRVCGEKAFQPQKQERRWCVRCDHRVVPPSSPACVCLFASMSRQVAARIEEEAGSKVLVNACCPGE